MIPIANGIEIQVPAITAATPQVIVDTNLTPAQVSRTVINNNQQTAAATLILPPATEGYTFIAIISTNVAQNWTIQRNGSDTIYWDSGGVLTAGKTYFRANAQAVGSRASCATFPVGGTWKWVCGSVSGTWTTD